MRQLAPALSDDVGGNLFSAAWVAVDAGNAQQRPPIRVGVGGMLQRCLPLLLLANAFIAGQRGDHRDMPDRLAVDGAQPVQFLQRCTVNRANQTGPDQTDNPDLFHG